MSILKSSSAMRKILMRRCFWLLALQGLTLGACRTGDDITVEVQTDVDQIDSQSAALKGRQCTLFQKYVFHDQPGSYANCASVPIPYTNIVPRTSAGHLWSRTVPACSDGTDGPCLGNEIRCVDGTRAYYHIDKAMDAAGNPVTSNKWIFFFQGGGSCGKTGQQSAVDNCTAAYNIAAEGAEMSTRHANPSIQAVPAFENTEGILDDDPTSYFARYNRVEIYKCSYDRFAGNNAYVDATRGVTLYFHGRKMIDAVLKDLNRSRGTISDANDGILPSLADATHTIVTGNSGGSGGLIQNADWIESLLNVYTSAQVRFVLDARINTSIESESHFENGGGGGNLYSGDLTGVSTLNNGTRVVSITRSPQTYQPGGGDSGLLETWGDPASTTEPFLDASCFATHAADPSLCKNEDHVLTHHLSVHRFMYQSLRDANHKNNQMRWVSSWTNSPAPFVWVPRTPVSLRFWSDFTNRIVYIADQFSRFRSSSDEMPSAPIYDLAIMVPNHERHINVIDNHYFKVASMTRGAVTHTFASALKKWIEHGGDMLMVDDSSTAEKSLFGGGWSTTP